MNRLNWKTDKRKYQLDMSGYFILGTNLLNKDTLKIGHFTKRDSNSRNC